MAQFCCFSKGDDTFVDIQNFEIFNMMTNIFFGYNLACRNIFFPLFLVSALLVHHKLLFIPPKSLGEVVDSVGVWNYFIMIFLPFLVSYSFSSIDPCFLMLPCSGMAPSEDAVSQQGAIFFPLLDLHLFPHNIPLHMCPLCLPMRVYCPV